LSVGPLTYHHTDKGFILVSFGPDNVLDFDVKKNEDIEGFRYDASNGIISGGDIFTIYAPPE